jgi:hypothetical protein
MAFNVSNISPYVNETAGQLIKKAVATGKTIDIVNIIPGIKYKQTINILDNTAVVKDATCGFTSNGSVAFLQREMEVTDMEIKESLCEGPLQQYFLGQSMKAGSPKEDQLGAILAESYVEKIKEYNELNLWQGGLGSPAYGVFNGFIEILSHEVTRVTPSAIGTPNIIPGPFTASTIIAVVDAMVANIPEAILMKPDLTLFMSMSNYMLYTAALRTANLFHYNGENGVNFETIVPGTNVKVIGTHGLVGTDYMVLTYASNLNVGTDLLNEEEKFDIWYSKDNDEVRVNIKWKLGAQVSFPSQIVTNF